ncbi:hypothetical protein AAGV28_07125 [Flavobacterium sp. FZUC8N2.13]|uniref:Uncharacterized protein n=1 Tax=Flavobacterium zubiriense TaxID=3138075 RepID=A0ABV4TAL5_9FLAO
MEAKFKVAQDVIYEGKEVSIEEIFDDGTCKIDNPFWSDEDDDDTPFWIVVKMEELKEINL